MSLDVAVVGSCNLDLVVTVDAIPLVGQTVLGGDLAQIPGGKGANQAVATSRLGHSAAFIGRIGDDDNGKFLKQCLQEDNVCLLYTSPSPRDRTRSRMPSSA